jgi:prepilin signal peptidase PulO-like enzyme (type II secretory pathway)
MEIVVYTFVLLFGMLIGSFLNVVIYRMPRNKSVVFPRSSCPKCSKLIYWYENIPVISYIFLKGRCSNCNAKISIRYPLVEMLCGLIAVLLLPDHIHQQSIIYWVVRFSIACSFIAHFMIDIEHKILPDKINLYLLLIIFTYSVINYHWKFWLFGGLIGFLGPLSITWVFYKVKGQMGLGGGDIKLYGILGLLLGPLGILSNIFMSSFVGALIGLMLIYLNKMSRDTHLPFGPFIIVVAALQFFLPEIYNLVNPFNFM